MTRDRAITIRFSEEERNALEVVAKNEDVSVATIVRRAVRREMERIKADEKKGKRP